MSKKSIKRIDRINRSTFVISYLPVLLISLLLVFVNTQLLSDDTTLAYISALLSLLLIVYFLKLASKRFHDLNEPALAVVLLFVPIVNIYILFRLLLKSGVKQDNKYGPQPYGSYIFKGRVEQNNDVNILATASNRTAHWDFAKITKYMVGFAAVLAIITSYFWYNQLYMTPERRFWLSINNSMATPSVVRTLTEGGSGNQVVQQYRFNFAPQRSVQNKVTYTEKSAVTDTSVVTEGVIYPTEQYLRYTEFTNNRSDNQTPGNIDEVLGEWASSISEDTEQAQLNYLSEQVSLVIFGNYGANFRNELLSDMQNQQVYGPNLNDALEDSVDGKDVYIYNVSVKLKVYAEMLNDAFVEAGFGEFPPLNPDNYREDSLVNAQIIVNKKNNTVVSVNFGGREERYDNYGVNAQVEKPEANITVEELQQKVQQLLQVNF